MDKKLEINGVDPIGYSEMWVDYSVRSSLTNDLLYSEAMVFEYLDDLSTGVKEGWEIWQCRDDSSMFVNIKVKYSSEGLPEEFIEAQDLRYE